MNSKMPHMKNPSHPGEILYSLYLEPLEMSAITLARRLNLPRTRIERLIKGTTSVTPDTAFRLAHFFGTTPQFWMNMQINYDIAHTKVDFSNIEPLSA